MTANQLQTTLNAIAATYTSRQQHLFQLGGTYHRHGWSVLTMTKRDLPVKYRNHALPEDIESIRNKVADTVLNLLDACTYSDGCLNLTETIAEATREHYRDRWPLPTLRTDPDYALIETLSDPFIDDTTQTDAERLTKAQGALSILKRERDRLLLQLGQPNSWCIIHANYNYLPEPYDQYASTDDLSNIASLTESMLQNFMNANGDYDDGESLTAIIARHTRAHFA